MESFFLYLPLHYAEARGWFGLVPDVDVVLLTLDRTATPSDDATYQQLLPKQPNTKPKADLVLCDPLCVFEAPIRHGRTACVLAAVVTNAAFWALNHGHHDVRTFTDLGLFPHVIAFHKGSTSHRIASAIGDASGVTPQIHMVKPGAELMRLVRSDPGTLALTPDALGIVALRDTHPDVRIELDISKTNEFANHIATVLVTSTDILNQSRAAIRGIVQALQISMDLCRKADPDVIKYAARFHQKPDDQVIQALRLAIEAQLYPESVAISRGQWLTAVGAKDSPLTKTLAQGTELRANDIYDRHVSPYLSLTQGERASALSVTPDVAGLRQMSPLGRASIAMTTASVLIITGAIAFAASQLSTLFKARYVQAVSAAFLTLGLGLLVLKYYRADTDRTLHRSLAPVFLGAACVVGLWYAQILSDTLAAQIVSQAVSFAFAVVLSARLWHRNVK